MREAVIVSAVRTAVGRAPRGSLRNTRPDDMAGWVVKEALNRAAGLKPEEVDDVVMGCSFPEAEQGLNVARLICYIAGLPYTVPGQTVNRFCSSGLQAIAIGAEHIMCGFADVIIAGGSGIHVHGSHGREQDRPQPQAHRDLPRGLYGHGGHRGKCGPEIRDQPGGSGCLCPEEPSESCGGDQGGKVQG